MGAEKIAAELRDGSKPSSTRHRYWHQFFSVYGWLGIPMLVAFVVSALWSAMLAIIQIEPTVVANRVMRTAELDSGEFWLLTKPDQQYVVPAAATLMLCTLGYGFLVLAMLFPHRFVAQKASSRWLSINTMRIHTIAVASRTSSRVFNPNATSSNARHPRWQRVHAWSSRLAGWVYRNRDVRVSPSDTLQSKLPHPSMSISPQSATLSLPKLVFQTTTLISYLHEGFPLAVVFSYSSLLLINWFFSAFRSTHASRHYDPSLVATRLYNSFDLFFAVFAPLHVLVYAYANFTFNRSVFETRIAAFSPEDFDRTARLFADPTEISLVTIAFEHLLLTTTMKIWIKLTLNVFAIIRWYFVIVQLTRPKAGISTESQCDDGNGLGRHRGGTSMSTSGWLSLIRRLFSGLIICSAGISVFAYTIVAVTTTKRLCEPYQQCKVPSYRWNVGETHCSCLVFVDRETAISTIAEWENPPSAADDLAFLAYSGHLKIIQIINRQLPFIPPHLRRCTDLEQLILIYTKILAIPDWTKELSSLKYLHIEGDVTTKQLTAIPRDLFDNMSRLKFLHLGCLLSLPYVPDLLPLVSLEYLALAMLHTIREVPSLDRLARLKKLSIVDDIRLYGLPHLSKLRSLNTLAVSYRTPVCCNGFISGACNLTAFACLDRSAQGEPRVECATDRILPHDYKVLMTTDGVVCPPDLPFDLKDIKPTLETTDEACGGVLYKQCWIHGVEGICFPARMQPVSCQIDPNYTKMRRLQIERRVGDLCDPDVEHWLGCSR